MRIQIVRGLFKFSSALCLAFATACSWYQETYHNPDRDCGPSGVGVFVGTSCRAYIEMACPQEHFPVVADDWLSGAPPAIHVRLLDGPEHPLVGNLFASVQPFPIIVRGESPWRVLQRDVERILVEQNIIVTTQAGQADYVLEPDMTYLDVRSEPGGFTDTKGVTTGRARFEIALIDRTGEEVWEKTYASDVSYAFTYAYLEDSERTLGLAYCGALAQFAEEIRTVLAEHS